MTKKALIKILLALAVFIIIEFLRLGYIRKDTAREYENQNKFEIMNSRVEQLEERVSYLEEQLNVE